MMRTVAWVALGWLGVTFWTALGARLHAGHVIPDAAVMTVAFLALHREPGPLVAAAAALGYLVGRQALAPLGLHETALVLCSVGAYLAGGHLVGRGHLYFGVLTALTAMAYHLVLFVLVALGRGHAAFSGWATAALVPGAVLTALAAVAGNPIMLRIERRLSPAERAEGLSWR